MTDRVTRDSLHDTTHYFVQWLVYALIIGRPLMAGVILLTFACANSIYYYRTFWE